MSELLTASVALLWIVVALEGFLLLGTLRHVGRLALRMGPENPLYRQTEIGRTMVSPALPAPDGRTRLLLFVSPSCGVCAQVLRGVAALIGDEAQLIVVSQADEEASYAYLLEHGLGDALLVADPDGALSNELGVRETPVAVVTEPAGMTLQSAIVNSARQVESLLLAARSSAA